MINQPKPGDLIRSKKLIYTRSKAVYPPALALVLKISEAYREMMTIIVFSTNEVEIFSYNENIWEILS